MDLPERKLKAKYAKSVFFDENNNIDVYIEDTAFGYQKLFIEVLNRVFEGKYEINNVFPLGSRKIVIEKCREEQGQFQKPTLFIVDGDLHLLNDIDMPELEGLFILPFYCIENILVDENAILEFLNEEEAEKLHTEIKEKFDFQGWVDANCELLTELFIVYALVMKFNPEIKTVAYSVDDLVSSGDGHVDPIKIRTRIESLVSEVKQNMEVDVFESVLASLKEKVDNSTTRLLKYVSGKDYLLPLLIKRIRSTVKTKCPHINMKIRIAKRCDISRMLGAVDHIAEKL